MKKIKIILMIFGSIAALVTAEVIARKILPNNLPVYSFSCYQKGVFFWIGFKPNSECKLISNRKAFPTVSIKTNSEGLRNAELSQKEKGTFRILMLGDSYMVGWGVEETKSIPRQTETFLRQRFPNKKIEVVNAGLTTADIGYYYLFLKNNLKKINPDIVIVSTYLENDIYDSDIQTIWDKTEASGLPVYISSATSVVDSTGNIISTNTPWLLKNGFSRKSALLRILLSPRSGQKKELKKFKPLTFLGVCLFRKNCHELDTEKLRAQKLIVAMKAMSDRSGTPLLFALIPVEFQVDPGTRPKFLEIIPLSTQELSFPNTELAAFFQKENIMFLDLLNVLKQYPSKKTYFDLDTHLTPFGNEVAAHAISSTLSSWIK